MPQPPVARPHGGVRGANLSRSSVLFQGAFGRIFRTLPSADYGSSDTDTLKKIVTTIDKVAGGAFKNNCPLWTYVLAETVPTETTLVTSGGNQVITTYQLGPVGGRIVAETFIGIMLADSSSFISQEPLWKPFLGIVDGQKFGLRELIKYALED